MVEADPAEVLLQFALAVYGGGDVRPARRYLQNRFGLDVDWVLSQPS